MLDITQRRGYNILYISNLEKHKINALCNFFANKQKKTKKKNQREKLTIFNYYTIPTFLIRLMEWFVFIMAQCLSRFHFTISTHLPMMNVNRTPCCSCAFAQPLDNYSLKRSNYIPYRYHVRYILKLTMHKYCFSLKREVAHNG